ncbi:hypothetical protein ACFYZJ_17700 [Streptomyces sp. NPDC001848]|uniref:hypothetical protein n=1 Tax=Streptomyces sp. NPDC001848 TaxID=3364618 RepID=UPI0036A6A5EC
MKDWFARWTVAFGVYARFTETAAQARRGRPVTHAFFSDPAEKILTELSPTERAAVKSVRRSLEDGPAQGRGLPDADPRSESRVVVLLPEQTGGRGISVVYRYCQGLNAVLILWLIAGP